MPPMNFDQALRADRWHALTLGIPGMSPGADASRLRTARRVWQEYAAYSQRVYDSQIWTYDPDPQPSFCLYRLIEAGCLAGGLPSRPVRNCDDFRQMRDPNSVHDPAA